MVRTEWESLCSHLTYWIVVVFITDTLHNIIFSEVGFTPWYSIRRCRDKVFV